MAEEPKVIDTTSNLSPEEALRVLDESEYSDTDFNEMMDLYEGTLETIEQGEIVAGTVLAIHDGTVVVDIGFKSEGSIPISEFGDPPTIEVGDEVEVFLESVEDQEGQVVLSKTKADFMRVWDRIKEAYDNDQIVEGRLVRRIKGGIVVDLFGVDAFLPGSQIDIKQVKNFDQFIGDVFPFRIIKLNKNRRNIVVSRRVVLEQERERLRKEILQTLEVGQVRQGTVKNITDFGAFIDLGGLDGLLHITDIAWGRVGHPSDVLSIGDEVEVKVLNYDEERERIRREEEAKARDEALKNTAPAVLAKVEEAEQSGAMPKDLANDLKNTAASLAAELAIDAAKSSKTVTVGEINALISPIKIDAAGIQSFGIKSVGKKGAAVLFAESDVTRLCGALVSHLTDIVMNQRKAA